MCHTRGHWSEECLYLQKIVSTPTSLYCKFCKYVGHDEKDCRTFQLLQENTVDTYLMKIDEKMQVEWAQAQYQPAQYPLAQYQKPQYPQLQYQQNQYMSQQQYPQPRGVEIFGAKDNNNKEEEDLVKEEAKSYVITMEK